MVYIFFDTSRCVINMLFTSRNNSVISAGRYFRRRNRPSKNDCHSHAVKRKHPVGAMDSQHMGQNSRPAVLCPTGLW